MIEIPFDPDNPIDKTILKSINNYINDRRFCISEDHLTRRILQKWLANNQYSFITRKNKGRVDAAIEIGIRKRIERTGMSRDDVIREAFCLHFDIPFTVSCQSEA